MRTRIVPQTADGLRWALLLLALLGAAALTAREAEARTQRFVA